MKLTYRPEIDGLRAIAVVAVCFFHAGMLPLGYLGVDAFFAISGFLITSIIIKESSAEKFSLSAFYERRIRRILPLSFFACSVALGLGYFVMLPDDLENLAQSVVATNLFANNILLAITAGDYWAPVNEFKPLMHTWSLAIEEQFYLLYPLVVALIAGLFRSALLGLLLSFALFSISLNFLGGQTFNFPHFRFWELLLGGSVAFAVNASAGLSVIKKITIPALCGMVVLLLWPWEAKDSLMLKMLAVTLTIGILWAGVEHAPMARFVLSNSVVSYLGKISYSVYFWHQILFAFARYAVWGVLTPTLSVLIIAVTMLVSAATYHFVEQPFRNSRVISRRMLLIIITTSWIALTASATGIYLKAGIVRDVPELDIVAGKSSRGIHAAYNDSVYRFDRDFVSHDRIKVLVVGNSIARYWVNVLLESKFVDSIEVTYNSQFNPKDLTCFRRGQEADIVFWSHDRRGTVANLDDIQASGIEQEKIWVVGNKNFGVSNGIHYNYRGQGYYQQRTRVLDRYILQNDRDRLKWPERYIDLLGLVMDQHLTVPVFTPDQKYISQDCIHLTPRGAQFIGQLVDATLTTVLQGE
jgi:peptidoglycan/LPS O-acetylase OafA/YrhL